MCNVIKMLESDKDKSSTWGGQRPGAGNKFKWNSGETKAVRIPIAIADEVLEAAKAIDAGKHLVADDCVTHSSATRVDDEARYFATLEGLEAANHKLSKEVGELRADLFRVHQQLQQVTKERDDYFDRISDIQLELDNLKDDSVTQSNPSESVTQSSEVNLEKIRDRILLSHPPKERRKLKTVLDQFIRQCASKATAGE
jgi:antitoxin component of MazEF toxin-antitoxin module